VAEEIITAVGAVDLTQGTLELIKEEQVLQQVQHLGQ
jgi:hypothetical protein